MSEGVISAPLRGAGSWGARCNGSARSEHEAAGTGAKGRGQSPSDLLVPSVGNTVMTVVV